MGLVRSNHIKQRCAYSHSHRHKSLILLTFLIVAAPAFAQTRPVELSPTALFPGNGATGICTDTPLRITFSSPPTLGDSGTINVYDAQTNEIVESIDVSKKTAMQTIGGLDKFTYYPVIISGNDATIHLHNHAFRYGRSYFVEIDPGVFKGGGDWPGFSSQNDWRFSTRPAAPTVWADLTVAADGSGDFCTIQGAIDFVPANGTVPVTIFVKNGTYTEIVCAINKNGLTIRGEDRKRTILAYSNSNKFAQKPGMILYHRGVFLGRFCSDLRISNMTIHNTTPRGGSQAEAIILNGTTRARAVLSDLDLLSYQDTLQVNGQAYVSNCYIEGDVDFVWGIGPCYFENCHLFETRDKAFYTQVRNTTLDHGFVFRHCILDGPPDITTSYLTRIDPKVYPASEVVFLDCTMGSTVQPVGWLLTGPKGSTRPSALIATTQLDLSQLHFWEFNSHDETGNPLDVSQRVAISKQLTEPNDAATIAKFNDPAWVLGYGWNPNVTEGTAAAGK
jgi:pectin methylesterase-like acyl-CoA thioesterase